MKDTALLPTILDGLDTYVKDLEILKVPNSSHWIMHDEPGLLIAKFIEFFNE
jgi:pimeloyl-ACP methyl ester carboxylesterase